MSAQSYKVVEVKGEPNPWTHKASGSKNLDYRCVFEGVDGDVEVTRKESSPAPKAGDELFGTLESKGQAGYTYKFRAQQQGGGGGGGGGYRGKSAEERAQDRANSAVIRTYEYFLIPEQQRPTLRDYLETAAKVHTALTRIEAGQAVVEP